MVALCLQICFAQRAEIPIIRASIGTPAFFSKTELQSEPHFESLGRILSCNSVCIGGGVLL